MVYFKKMLFCSVQSTPAQSVLPRVPLNIRGRKTQRKRQRERHWKKVKKSLKYPVKTRKGMSASVDSAFQKRGFNSLTGKHTFWRKQLQNHDYGR